MFGDRKGYLSFLSLCFVLFSVMSSVLSTQGAGDPGRDPMQCMREIHAYSLAYSNTEIRLAWLDLHKNAPSVGIKGPTAVLFEAFRGISYSWPRGSKGATYKRTRTRRGVEGEAVNLSYMCQTLALVAAHAPGLPTGSQDPRRRRKARLTFYLHTSTLHQHVSRSPKVQSTPETHNASTLTNHATSQLSSLRAFLPTLPSIDSLPDALSQK